MNKKYPINVVYKRSALSKRDTDRLKVKEWMKIHNSNTNQKEITGICRRYHRLGSKHQLSQYHTFSVITVIQVILVSFPVHMKDVYIILYCGLLSVQ